MADQPDIQDTIDNLLAEEREEDQETTNKLARLFYGAQGYHVPQGYRFDRARHPQERMAWNQASLAICFAREHFHIPEP